VIRRADVAVVVAGGALAIVTAAVYGLPAEDTLVLLAVSFGTAFVVACAGHLAFRTMRGVPVGQQAVVVALVAAAGTAAGAAAAARAMFVSSHDLQALLVVLTGSATVAVAAALRLGRRVGSASAALSRTAQRVGNGGGAFTPVARDAPRELAALAAELTLMEQRLDASSERERALDRSRRELVAWVSHDLRTPLAGIRAMVEALSDGVVDDRATVDRYYATIQDEADRLAALVDDLFELSRIQADALHLTPESVPLDELVADAVASTRPLAERKGVRLEGTSAAPGTVVAVSAPEMTRAMRNLIDNAIRHTPSGGRVQVEVLGEDGSAFVAVTDSCGGIPDGDLDRVFDLAFRGDEARSRADGDGTGGGFGLAIARGLVEAHEGEISVRNDGLGCRFTIALPAQRSTRAMSRTARTVPSTDPVTLDRPVRTE
jgi:signal transduction histidine kinase